MSHEDGCLAAGAVCVLASNTMELHVHDGDGRSGRGQEEVGEDVTAGDGPLDGGRMPVGGGVCAVSTCGEAGLFIMNWDLMPC